MAPGQHLALLYGPGRPDVRRHPDAAILDIDSGEETIYADDVEIGDIIWMGPQPTVASKAALVGVANSAPYAQVDKAVKAAIKAGRKVHYIAPSRYFNKLRLMEMIGRARIDLGVSEPLTKAIISMRRRHRRRVRPGLQDAFRRP